MVFSSLHFLFLFLPLVMLFHTLAPKPWRNAVLLAFSARTLYSLFFREAEIIAIGLRLTPPLILTVVFQILMVVYIGCLRGAGDIRYTTKVAIFSVVIVRTGVSYFFGNVLQFGIVGIWVGVMADQFFRCLLGMLRFRSGKWTAIKV